MFYIQPPKGLITLHTLEEIVFSRLDYLNILNNEENQTFNGKFEYLLLGSPYDYVGHFTLRLLALRLNSLCSNWINKETLLFQRRLSLMQSGQLYRFFKTIFKHVNRREKLENPVVDILISISSFYLEKEVFKHIISKYHSKDCTKYYQKIDFELIPDLIETKSVHLTKGLAIVYCSQWRQLLQSLFQTFILYEMKSQSKIMEYFLADPRLNIICQKLQHYLFTKGYNCGKITTFNIDDESFYFPPCMVHLHLELRHKHRLSHYARFYYSLFLKECGMTLEEALIYWENEYSKPHNCTSYCTHNWQTNTNKFIYSIRHIYGLEGGKKNYRCPDCRSIRQQIPGSKYEGGCPFSNFDADSLKSLLCKLMDKSELDQFMLSALKQKPQNTCATYFKLKSTKYIHNITINNPVQYYLTMNELN